MQSVTKSPRALSVQENVRYACCSYWCTAGADTIGRACAVVVLFRFLPVIDKPVNRLETSIEIEHLLGLFELLLIKKRNIAQMPQR